MPKRTSILIGALVLVYVVMRLWRLTDSCLWFDEIFGVHAAEHTWGGMLWFVAQDLIHPPLFYALLKLWVTVGGEGLLWLRLFPVFFSALSIVPFLYLCRELKLPTRATAVSLAFLAVNGPLIKYAQEVRMYSLLLCLSLFSVWLFARFFYRGKNIWVLTLVNVLLVHTHYFGWLVVLSEVVAILVLQRIKIRHVLVMAGISAVSFVPWVLTVFRAANAGSEVSQNIGWIKPPGIRSLFELATALVEPFHFRVSTVDPATVFWVSVPLLLLIVAAATVWLANWKTNENKDRGWMLGVLVSVPIAAAFLLSWLSPYSVWGVRHLIIVFAPASILVGVVLAELEPAVLRWPMVGAAGVLMIGAGARSIASPPQEQIWCAWTPIAKEWILTPYHGTPPKRLYLFEDLAAYHVWFGSRGFPNSRVTLVQGAGGVPNDPAYFLPRGFDGIDRLELSQVGEPEIWIAFRQRTKEIGPGSHQRRFEAPVTHLENMGYVVEDVRQHELGGQSAFLVRMVRFTGRKAP